MTPHDLSKGPRPSRRSALGLFAAACFGIFCRSAADAAPAAPAAPKAPLPPAPPTVPPAVPPVERQSFDGPFQATKTITYYDEQGRVLAQIATGGVVLEYIDYN